MCIRDRIRRVDRSVNEILDGPGIQLSELAAKIQQLHIFFSLLIPDMSHEERQLLGNYATWKQGGGIPGDGTSPVSYTHLSNGNQQIQVVEVLVVGKALFEKVPASDSAINVIKVGVGVAGVLDFGTVDTQDVYKRQAEKSQTAPSKQPPQLQTPSLPLLAVF